MFIFVISTANLLAFLLFGEVQREEFKLTKRLFNHLLNQENDSFFYKKKQAGAISKKTRHDIYIF